MAISAVKSAVSAEAAAGFTTPTATPLHVKRRRLSSSKTLLGKMTLRTTLSIALYVGTLCGIARSASASPTPAGSSGVSGSGGSSGWYPRTTRDWRTVSTWSHSTKAWDRGFSTRRWSYPTPRSTRQWDPYLNQGYSQGQLVRYPDGQIVQYGSRPGGGGSGLGVGHGGYATGGFGHYTQTPVIHYQQGIVPTATWKPAPECKPEQMERCFRECEERKIHSFTCRPQFGVAFTCMCSVSIYIPNVAV